MIFNNFKKEDYHYKMKFQILSDIHLEHYDSTDFSKFLTKGADTLIIAGDISRSYKLDKIRVFLEYVCSKFDTVIYVFGNHEYYIREGTRVSDPKNHLRETKRLIEKEVKHLTNLHILSRESHHIIDNICIIGCTLWSDLGDSVLPYWVSMVNPYFTTKTYTHEFREDLAYIKRMINYAKGNDLIPFVVTHYVPSFFGSTSHDPKGCLYNSNLDYLLTDKNRVHTWVFGHSHRNYDNYSENMKTTRVVSNQRGKDFHHSFNPMKVIDVC
jgi:predicted phosphodiesterase